MYSLYQFGASAIDIHLYIEDVTSLGSQVPPNMRPPISVNVTAACEVQRKVRAGVGSLVA
jgi:hypothetical protein